MAIYYIDPVLAAAAIIPAVVLLIKVYQADRLEKEPVSLILSLVFFGVLSTAIAMVLEQVGTAVLGNYLPEGSVAYNAVLYFGIVAFSEEGAKYILLKKRTWRDINFNCQFDGVVYGMSVSLGFALWENLGYVAMYGFGTALVRAVTAVPGHACFGVFMGAWYGMAKRWEGAGFERRSKTCRTMALLLPALIHGCYDFIATYEDAGASGIFAVFVVLLFVVSLILVRRLSANDRYINNSGRFFF